MSRLHDKQILLVGLGALFGPLQHLVSHPDQYDAQERAETIARYFAESQVLGRSFNHFCVGQTGHNYAVEQHNFHVAIDSIRSGLIHKQELSDLVTANLPIAMAAIDAIPVPPTSVILEAGSPFTAYCRLRELCECDATDSLVWLDAYISGDIFHRYVRNVREGVAVTLVTVEPGPHAGARNRARWAEFLDVSRLYAQERGNTLYRLVLQQSLHDRWTVFDHKRIYALGGSAKDAGSQDYFTIASVDATDANLQKIQLNIDTGTELFGPTVSVHL